MNYAELSSVEMISGTEWFYFKKIFMFQLWESVQLFSEDILITTTTLSISLHLDIKIVLTAERWEAKI